VVQTTGGFIAVSTNGVDWSQPTRVPVKNDVGGLAYGNGIHVEAGYKRTGLQPRRALRCYTHRWARRPWTVSADGFTGLAD
jgi:hypothetical protein